MLQVTEIAKSYGAAQALQPTTLRFERGRTTALLGPSGCGKSTLLRIIVGLVRPDQGQVQLDGVELGDRNIRQMRHRMGYMIQDGGLFPHLTAGGNAALLAEHLRWQRSRIVERLDELAQLVHLPLESLERYPGQLSGGQRQRVSLMRALFLDPDVLLLDEPMGALDPMIRADLQDELRVIFQRLHKTVVMVTHDIAEAAYLADTVALLRDGRVVQQGKVEELVARPAEPFVGKFFAAQHRELDPLGGGER